MRSTMDLRNDMVLRPVTDEDRCLAALTVCEVEPAPEAAATLVALGLLEEHSPWDELRYSPVGGDGTWPEALPAVMDQLRLQKSQKSRQ